MSRCATWRPRRESRTGRRAYGCTACASAFASWCCSTWKSWMPRSGARSSASCGGQGSDWQHAPRAREDMMTQFDDDAVDELMRLVGAELARQDDALTHQSEAL